MPKPKWLAAADTRDDRREVLTLLNALPPSERVAWVRWCCSQATLPRSEIHPRVSRYTHELAAQARWDDAASERLTILLMMDLCYLCTDYQLDMVRALDNLEARGRRYRPEARAVMAEFIPQLIAPTVS